MYKARRGEVYTRFCWGKLKKRDHSDDLGVNWRIILKWIFKQWNEEARTGFMWLSIGTGVGLLLMQY